MLRNPNTIPATDTIIEDPMMEPFFITKSTSGGFTVYERVTRGEKDNEYLRTVCYPSNFGNALKKVAKELLNHSDKKHYGTVKEYIQSWNDIEQKINTITMLH